MTTMRTDGGPAFDLELERLISVPRARVFEAWTRPEQIAQWFAPRPFPLAVDEMDSKASSTNRGH